MTYIIISIIAAALLVPGIGMSLVPGLPNLLYMLAIAICFAIYDDFVHISSLDLMILGIIVVVVMFIDAISGLAGAKMGGAHWSSVVSGLAGLVIGTLIIPLPIIGSLLGMFIGVLASEWYRTRDIGHSHKAAFGSLLGSVAGSVVRIIASLLFFVLFIIFVWS